jgi:hypothetical protein
VGRNVTLKFWPGLTCEFHTERFGFFWTLSLVCYMEVLQKSTTFRRLDLCPSSGGWGRIDLLSSFWRAQLSRYILPHPPVDGDRSSLRSVVAFCKTSTYETLDRVQKKPNSSVQRTPSSASEFHTPHSVIFTKPPLFLFLICTYVWFCFCFQKIFCGVSF